MEQKKLICERYRFFLQFWYCPCKKKIYLIGSGGIRTHAIEMTGALNQRLRPLGHATLASSWRCLVSVVSMIFNICHQWIYIIKSIFNKYCALPSTEPHFHTQNVKYVPLSIMEQKN